VFVATAGAALTTLALRFERFARLLDFGEGTTFFRLRVWESAIQMIRERPLTGLGLDQFLYAFQGRYMMPDAWQEPYLSHPHNLILDFWTRLGILGAALLLWTQIAFWRAALALYRAGREPLPRALVIGVMGCMVNTLAHGLVDNSIFVQDLIYAYMLLLGIIGQLKQTNFR
jgi:O-antigen ligase